MTTNKDASSKVSTKKSQPTVEEKPLSKTMQAGVDAATVKTKNDGSHITNGRKARLAKAQAENK